MHDNAVYNIKGNQLIFSLPLLLLRLFELCTESPSRETQNPPLLFSLPECVCRCIWK